MFQAPSIIEDRRPPRAWPQEGVVKMNDYATRYRPNLDLVLKGISCEFSAGEKVTEKLGDDAPSRAAVLRFTDEMLDNCRLVSWAEPAQGSPR